MIKKTYQAETPIKHDGKDYGVGDRIDLDDKESKDLLAVGALSDAVGAAGGAPTDDTERLSAIAAAIGRMDAEDGSLWLKSGAPKTEAIAAITGWPVAAADRNAVWEQISATK